MKKYTKLFCLLLAVTFLAIPLEAAAQLNALPRTATGSDGLVPAGNDLIRITVDTAQEPEVPEGISHAVDGIGTPCRFLADATKLSSVVNYLDNADVNFIRRHPLLGKVLSFADAMLDICTVFDAYTDCRDDGGNPSNCAGGAAVGGTCAFLGDDFVTATHPLGHVAADLAQVLSPDLSHPSLHCLPVEEDLPPGESSLSCCKYTESQENCHTGNMTANCPINFGKAQVPATGVGATCDHIAECSAPDAGDEINTPTGLLAPTLDQSMRTLEFHFKTKVEQAALNPTAPVNQDPFSEDPVSVCTPTALYNLASFRGFRKWRGLLEDSRPFNGQPETWLTDPTLATTLGEEKVYMALLANNAAARIVFGIPNGVQRFYIMNLTYQSMYDEMVDDHLADLEADLGIDIDPWEELAKWLSPCALEILIGTFHERWKVLAYPTPFEEPTDLNPDDYIDGVLMQEAPTITSLFFSPTDQEWIRTLTVEAQDSVYNSGAVGATIAVVEQVGGYGEVYDYIWKRNGAAELRNTYKYSLDLPLPPGPFYVYLINMAGKIAKVIIPIPDIEEF